MESYTALPKVIQGGMGVNVSGWHLARSVSLLGGRGTISGVVLQRLLPRVLQLGDPGGHMRRALSHFPFPHISEPLIKIYFVEGGIPKGKSFKSVPMFTVNPTSLLIALTVCSNFAFVWLAKENNPNPISINYLEKIAMHHVYAITGAMLAGVDYITMGAGIPLQIPKLIDDIYNGREASYRVPVIGDDIKSHTMKFDAEKFFGDRLPKMKKPGFVPIIASNLLANMFMKKLPAGSIDGFVVEEPTAGGHNAPPRKLLLGAQGEPLPVYGEKDFVDYPLLAKLGIPFWIGGSHASPEKLKWALSVGASGIQAGSIFALCEESGMNPELRKKIRKLGFNNELTIRTDMRISPTGFPFKVVELGETIADSGVYNERARICNQGELVSLYEKADGTIGYRCASEPLTNFFVKGGNVADCEGRGCLCNGLMSAVDLGNPSEAPIITMGDDLSFLKLIMKDDEGDYFAQDAMNYLLS